MLILSSNAFSIISNEPLAGGIPRKDGRKGCEIQIKPGLNSIADEVFQHDYLKSHIACGSVTLPDADEPPPRTVSKFLPPPDRAELPNPFADAAQHVIEPPPRDIGADPATEL